MPVNSTHAEYNAFQDRWRTVRDAADGQAAIKRGKERYLPEFYPPNIDAYDLLLRLAYYVNVTGRTKNGLIGSVFRKEPDLSLPASIEYLAENSDGAGSSSEQLSKHVVSELLIVGRNGLLSDYPKTERVRSKEEQEQNKIAATIKSYSAESIINWSTTMVNGALVLSMVVLKESKAVAVDEFSSKTEDQYRVLILKDGLYEQHIYDHQQQLIDVIEPLLPNGERWRIIPFVFIGAENNLPSVDIPPLEDLANINIAHYRNVADVESSLRTFSQVMLHVDIGDMSADQWKELNPNGVMFGSSFGLQTVKGNASIIQASPHNFGTEAVKDKEQQMISVGARLITPTNANETAEAARINASSETSVLSTVVGNASEGIEQAMEYCAMFMGANPEEIEFSLNREFFDHKLTAQEYMALIQFADRGDIAQSDLRNTLRKTSLLSDTRTDEMIEEENQDQPPV